jgi:hypothetical protein
LVGGGSVEAAYKALAEDGNLFSQLTFSPDDLIEWNG